MPNPYHDSEGKFTSRNGMLKAIDRLAISRKIDEYIKLRAEFDEIDSANVHVPQDFYNKVLEKANISPEEAAEAIESGEPIQFEQPTIAYHNLDSETLAQIIGDLGSHENEDNSEQILRIVKASGNDKNVIYAAIESDGLTYEQKADLVNTYQPTYYGFLVESDPENVFKHNKPEFMKAVTTGSLRAWSEVEVEDSTEAFTLSKMVEALAEHATTKEELDHAISNNPYGYQLNQQINSQIMSNPILSKPQALKVFTQEIRTGGENYWNARHAIVDNFKQRGLPIPAVPEFKENVKPVQGEPTQTVVSTVNFASEDDKRKMLPNYELASAMVIYDSYEGNFNKLKKDVAILEKVSKRDSKYYADSRYLKARYDRVRNYLNQLEDFENIKPYLQD